MKKIDALRRAASAKIKSNKGASLSIALLLFLVCTVIGAVVLTAGTAAAGRFADMPAADQRYYSVASAAQLLAKELDGREVTIVRTKTTTSTTKYEATDGATLVPYGTDTETTVYSADVYNKSYKTAATAAEITAARVASSSSDSTDSSDDGLSLVTRGNGGASGTGVSFLTARAIYLLFGKNESGAQTLYGCKDTDPTNFMNRSFATSPIPTNKPETTTFTLNHTKASGSIDADSLASIDIEGTSTLNADGTITIDISNKTADSSDPKFTVTMTLHPVFTETQASTTTGGDSPSVVSETGIYTYEKTTTLTKTSTVSWEVANIKKKILSAVN